MDSSTHTAARRWRRALGLSVSELAREIGIRRSCLSEWEHGKRHFSAKAELRVVRALRALAKSCKDLPTIRAAIDRLERDQPATVALLRTACRLERYDAKRFMRALTREQRQAIAAAINEAQHA